MKTEGIESIPNGGLKVSTATFTRLKAFQGGGDYWDHQDLVRESLGEFLPPVQQILDADKRFGIFRKSVAGRETLWKSRPARGSRVPEEEIRRLTSALETFKRKANSPDTQQNARDIIQHFRLPDISKDPDLYRICGPWWDRKLQILWGCERIPDSSLAPTAAVTKIPIDKSYGLKRALALLLLLCTLLAALIWGWPALKHWAAKEFNRPPTAAVRLESLDETNRIATVSDAGSHDPDGTLQLWRVAWGDGKEDQFSQPPKTVSHTYETERDYTILLWCVDNYGATSAPPASVDAKFNYDRNRNALAEANRIGEQAQHDKDAAEQKLKETQRDKDAAEQKLNETEQKLKAFQEAAEHAKTSPEPVAQIAPQIPPSTNPAPSVADQEPPAPISPPEEPDGTPTIPKPLPVETPSRPVPVMTGAQKLMELSGRDRREPLVVDDLDLEILKGGVGSLTSENTLEAILVIRDRKHPNASLDVLEWVVDSKPYATRNAQFTTPLEIREHEVSVKVRHSGIEQTAKARVIVTGALTQTTEPDFTVSPLPLR